MLKMRANLLGLGFEVYCVGKLKLAIRTTSSPFLTWSEGSVGSGVPTPNTVWIGVSFRDSQPPLAIGFLSGPAGLQIQGSAGDWTLETVEDYKGWIRICAPNGIMPYRTNGAAELGDFAKLCKKLAMVISSPTPMIKSQSVLADSQGIDLNIELSGAGAVIPSHWMMAPIAGYPVKVSGSPEPTTVQTESGPVYLHSLPNLRVRFPARRVPLGRAIGLGNLNLPEPGTVSSLHIPGVVELALINLLANATQSHRMVAQETLDQFFEEAHYAIEPFSKQQLPFNSAGADIDVVGAHALLLQAMQNNFMEEPQNNSLLMSLSLRRDWFSGRLWVPDFDAGRGAMSLAALAGALSPEPERRLDGAMFEAALMAERGLEIWKRRRSQPVESPAKSGALLPLREALFTRTLAKRNAFADLLLSLYRLTGPRGFGFQQTSLTVVATGNIMEKLTVSFGLHTGFELAIRPKKNVENLVASGQFGTHRILVKPRDSGDFQISFDLPTWAPKLPSVAPIPGWN